VDTLSSELSSKQRQFGTNVKINLIIIFVTNVMICNKYNDEVIVLAVCSGGVLQECAAEFPAGSRGRAVEGGQGEPNEAVGFLALG